MKGSAATKLEKLAVSARHSFQEAVERGAQFRRQHQANTVSLREIEDPRNGPHVLARKQRRCAALVALGYQIGTN